jgi:2-polyprenyl-3-methyl-5-hydroxy-6-metoxy-1,4-benzoquinol methylase
MTDTLTPRQQRERDFYNRYAQQCDTRVNLEPVQSDEQRPWNSYWHFYRLVKDRFRPGHRLLDFGCGWGSKTILFAKVGYDVDGFDIAEGNLEVARTVANEHGVADRVRLHLMAAETLDFPDATFDVIAGIDILHHVQIEPALSQCRRLLKPGGVAFFREPVASFLFDSIRNTWLLRKLFPNKESLDRHITHDERKLDSNDLKRIKSIFPKCRFDRFRVLARLSALWPSKEGFFEKIDYRLLNVPGYQSLAGSVVLTLEKE